MAAWAARLQRALDTSPVDEAAAVRALEALKGFGCPSKKDLKETGLSDLLRRIDRAASATCEEQMPFNVKVLGAELSETWFD